MSYAQHNPSLYQWKRFSKQKSSEARRPPKPKNDDIRCWLEKVEAATDAAVRKTFSEYNTTAQSGSRNDVLQSIDKLHDDDNAHTEAQELVTNWMNEKIRFDFLENEAENEVQNMNSDNRNQLNITPGIESTAHEKWYEDSDTFIQQYLDKNSIQSKSSLTKNPSSRDKHFQKNDVLGQLDIYEADESTVVEALMRNMMEKPLIKPSEMKILKRKENESNKSNRKFQNPKMTMDMRHKEVKEARLRRQKEEEKKRQERMIQREVKFKAQQILKEEELQKKLRKKQEEEAIQMEMTRLRKEMIEQRKREERDQREREKEVEKEMTLKNQKQLNRRHELEQAERNKQKEQILSEISRLEEKERRVAEVMKKRNTENRILLHNCFNTWCKTVLNQRIKLGKAKALSDWKCIQKVWAAWKSFTRNQRLDIETKHHQANVREIRLKEKKAVDCEKFRLLRKSFITWKVWVKTEQESKEILKQQQTTKAKMQALLNAVASRNVANKTEEPMLVESVESNTEVDLPLFQPLKPSTKIGRADNEMKNQTSRPSKPKHAWQVTKKDVNRLKPDEIRHLSDTRQTLIQPNAQQTKVKVHVQSFDPYGHRHQFQKEVIDQQRMLLHEQKRMIEEMQEQQKIFALQQEAAILQQQHKHLENNKIPAKNNLLENPLKSIQNDSNEVQSRIQSARSNTSEKSVAKKHPIVSKMEERAAERMKRRKELEDIKRKKEEERIKKIQEAEEMREREEQEKKRKEIEDRREAKRMQKKLEDEKKAAQQRLRELCRMADNHYVKSLLKNHGFLPWKNLVQSMKSKHEVADYHHNSVLMRKVLLEWKFECNRAKREREEKADQLYRVILQRRGMRSWRKYGERMEILEQKAILHRNNVLKRQYLKYWVDYTTDEKLSQWDKEARADAHNRTRQLRRIFNVIRSYRQLVLNELQRRKRLEEMRRKVTELLPDFQYSKDTTSDLAYDETEEEYIMK